MIKEHRNAPFPNNSRSLFRPLHGRKNINFQNFSKLSRKSKGEKEKKTIEAIREETLSNVLDNQNYYDNHLLSKR